VAENVACSKSAFWKKPLEPTKANPSQFNENKIPSSDISQTRRRAGRRTLAAGDESNHWYFKEWLGAFKLTAEETRMLHFLKRSGFVELQKA
jgi:hypothetical protein